MNPYVLLTFAITGEVFGSSMLKAANGFKKLWPSICVVIGYGTAFYALSLTLKTLPLGISYAIWSGLGTALTTLIGIAVYKEAFNRKKLFGLILIIGGIILLNAAKGGAH
ncbi:multidrug efflux SMR transporter [Bacillus sonorensis]|uniref:Small multidrug resistance protein n=3 Tax=Bacillaceae TaxID=186817 RepID=M5P8I4_9BACI|nr:MULTISPECIES: multidrug efflux SMR transporter [Bacillus]TWK84359.1 Multidrug resistance protein EbrA [Bacillus paralicheniformis]ASB89028.1 Multidrug resistance protein EbrB [Bacillus sonorensis]EME75748.1 small multidrug resistance protein [Bacillus sonorensis L12]MCZ0075184.1 multidrug efflux SMR transporter [Bacillus sonorensis]MCZ0093324.1 multidrug efflux SMR transporter [Bacillus sonorensis]